MSRETPNPSTPPDFIRRVVGELLPTANLNILFPGEAVSKPSDIREMSILVARIHNLDGAFDNPKHESMFLNELGRQATAVVGNLEGIVDTVPSSIHDLFAWWGAPGKQPDHALRAVQAALELRDSIEQLREIKSDIQLGIGVNTGEVYYGNIGGYERFDFTVIGNAARRAQFLAGESFPNAILLGESTFLAVQDKVQVKYAMDLESHSEIVRCRVLTGLR